MEINMNNVNNQHLTSKLLAYLENSIMPTFARILTNTGSFSAYIEPIVQLIRPKWKSSTISAKVTSVRYENSTIYTLTIRPHKSWNTFKAGQYVQLSAEKNGALITRTFSISSGPSAFKANGKIELTIRQQKNGLLTPWLHSNLKPGSTVYLSQASGDFTLTENPVNKLFIAAGSGITAIRPLLQEHKNAPWFKQAKLLFYVKNKSERLFLHDLEALEQYGLDCKFIYSEQDGRICKQHLNDFCHDLSEREVYICGPSKMIESTNILLQDQQVPKTNIHFEYFGPAPLTVNLADKLALEDEDEFIQVDYLNSKKQVSFKPESTPQTLLDMAEKEGLKPVSGCRIGICHQCICKKKQGRVYNTKTKQFSDTGSEEIQLCLSVPVSHVELEL